MQTEPVAEYSAQYLAELLKAAQEEPDTRPAAPWGYQSCKYAIAAGHAVFDSREEPMIETPNGVQKLEGYWRAEGHNAYMYQNYALKFFQSEIARDPKPLKFRSYKDLHPE